MKRPSFQFYPDDWTGNAKLKRCNHALKGVWIDVLCLMHDSEEYGVLRWPLIDLAQAIGCKVQMLRELVDKDVIKGAETGQSCAAYIHQGYHARQPLPPVTLIQEQDGPIWYSSRMVRDEYIRAQRGGATRFTVDNNPSRSPTERVGDTVNNSDTRSPNARLGDGAPSSSPSPSKSFKPSLNNTSGDQCAPQDQNHGDNSDSTQTRRRKAVDIAQSAARKATGRA